MEPEDVAPLMCPGIAGKKNIKMGRQIFPFEELQDAMILLKKGEIKEPNTVIKITSPENRGSNDS